ncbi:unnamed protein product (macronuclear) [Paramecium tetraurelia]|uniref:non-specific serine/threonine protein kinase n=1 Tax=Paramecium tetraurelia TaxID=5888 RepID=A0DR49_PARTE|nr:uncharacterized protein GSPATT00002917001 [Paramecium tetraurelia]CAK85516.1 unnamed protein product [Paramecium tetraurelia]|eukprot:XP_001452913.1 hypothetical protein (macronuclear) [Paramecium tetraurelia strain d4-2]
MQQLISQGAEAKIYKIQFLGDQAILKERLSKQYRLKQLDDRITSERVKTESRLLCKARQLGVNVPHLYYVDNNQIIMMFIDGVKLKDFLNALEKEQRANEIQQILNLVAQDIAKLHNGGIIHGDLTTSNILVQNSKPYFIDFGLSYTKVGFVEDYAVDLYVLEKAFLSTHPTLEDAFQILLEEYKKLSTKGQQVIDKLREVRQRGRKKVAFG